MKAYNILTLEDIVSNCVADGQIINQCAPMRNKHTAGACGLDATLKSTINCNQRSKYSVVLMKKNGRLHQFAIGSYSLHVKRIPILSETPQPMSYCCFHASADSRDGELRPLSRVFRATSALMIPHHGTAFQATCQLQSELHRRIGSWGHRPAPCHWYIIRSPSSRATLVPCSSSTGALCLRSLTARKRDHAMVQIMPRGRENVLNDTMSARPRIDHRAEIFPKPTPRITSRIISDCTYELG
ncbi:hypothetical protein ACQKWADRAFT_101161 [Trichoderma austrokoningii]